MTVIPPFPRRRGLAFVAAAASVAAVALVAAGCGPDPSSPTLEPAAFDGRLLVHTGRPEASQLFALDGRGRESEVATPEGGLRWFAAGLDGQLAGIGADGAIVVATQSGRPWRAVAMDEVPATASTADIRLPAWSPDGRLAVVFGDAEIATIKGVLVVDPATDGGLWVDLVAGLGGYPPAWLDTDRLAVPTRDVAADLPTISVLAVDLASIDPVIPDARAVVASPDASTLAVLAGSGVVELWRPAEWLAGGGEPVLGRIEPAGSSVVEAMALDRTGDRLAIGVSPADGDGRGSVRVLDGTDGWSLLLERPMAAGAPIGALGFVP